MLGSSSDFLGYSVLSDKSFLSEPSNAQVLQKQQLDAAAAQDFRKYLLIALVAVGGLYVATRLKK